MPLLCIDLYHFYSLDFNYCISVAEIGNKCFWIFIMSNSWNANFFKFKYIGTVVLPLYYTPIKQDTPIFSNGLSPLVTSRIRCYKLWCSPITRKGLTLTLFQLCGKSIMHSALYIDGYYIPTINLNLHFTVEVNNY